MAAGDEPGYRDTAADLPNEYGETKDPDTANCIALTCVVGDNAVDDVEKVVELARQAADADPRNPIPKIVLGAAQFRAGQPSARALVFFSSSHARLQTAERHVGRVSRNCSAVNLLFPDAASVFAGGDIHLLPPQTMARGGPPFHLAADGVHNVGPLAPC